MSLLGSRANYLRVRKEDREAKVDFVELFFDLVFVFAVTQISHHLLNNLTSTGLAETVLLLLAVWWVWVFTTWVTNWLDPQRTPVRLMLFVLMLAGLLLSTSIPESFESRGLVFAAAYVVMQVGRSIFVAWAVRHHDPANFRNFQRIGAWLMLSGLFWIAGGLVEDPSVRFFMWSVALAIEYVSPALGFWTPGLGASTTEDWNISGEHMAERCGLFIIIALGESILVAGSTFADMEWTPAVITAFVTSSIGTITMWWLYFSIGAEYVRDQIAESADPGRIARFAYTYLHIILVAGIILVAVADELILAHPVEHEADLGAVLTAVGGTAVYVVGNALFKRFAFGRWPLSHLVGMGLLALLAIVAFQLTPLAIGTATMGILILVAIWEFMSLRSLRH